MSEAGRDYVVYGMRARCSEGTMDNYISTDTGHGVVYQGCPLLNANDHTVQVNLTHFGDCNSKKIYEDAKKQVDEKFASEAGEGFFSKAVKWAAKTAIKASISVKEHLFFHKCELDTPLPWIFVNEEHMIDGAPALTIDSQCACRFGGIITIVPPETETAEVEATTGEGTMEPAMAGNVVEASIVTLSEGAEVSGEQKGKSRSRNATVEKHSGLKSSLNLHGGIGTFFWGEAESRQDILEDHLKELDEYQYIWEYVNEKTLDTINPEWTKNMDTFKQIYGDDVLLQMRILMWKYNITDEASILMFLSTMGEETGHGTSVIQGMDNYGNLEDNEVRKSYMYKYKEEDKAKIDSDLGIGLVQVTGAENQSAFIRYKYASLDDRDPMKGIMDNYFGESEIEGSNPLDNSAGFIYTYYPIEASMWFWAEAEIRQDTNVNDFIVEHKEDNLYNTFMCSQMLTNGTKYKADALHRFARYSQDCVMTASPEYNTGYTFTCPDEPGRKDYGPNNWEERERDWLEAAKLLQGD